MIIRNNDIDKRKQRYTGKILFFLFLLPTNVVGHLNYMFKIYCKNILTQQYSLKYFKKKKADVLHEWLENVFFV